MLLLIAGKEWVSCIGPVGAAKKVARSVIFVGSRLQRNTRDRTGLPTVFGFRILLRSKLLDGVDRQKRRSVAGKAD